MYFEIREKLAPSYGSLIPITNNSIFKSPSPTSREDVFKLSSTVSDEIDIKSVGAFSTHKMLSTSMNRRRGVKKRPKINGMRNKRRKMMLANFEFAYYGYLPDKNRNPRSGKISSYVIHIRADKKRGRALVATRSGRTILNITSKPFGGAMKPPVTSKVSAAVLASLKAVGAGRVYIENRGSPRWFYYNLFHTIIEFKIRTRGSVVYLKEAHGGVRTKRPIRK